MLAQISFFNFGNFVTFPEKSGKKALQNGMFRALSAGRFIYSQW